MDLINLATKTNADSGKWFRVELYGETTDLWVKILGADSDAVQKMQRNQFKKLSANTGADKKMTDETIDELLDSDIDSVLCRLVAIAGNKDDAPDESEELTIGEKVLGNDRDSFEFLITEIPALKKFIVDKSNERKNFLSLKRKN